MKLFVKSRGRIIRSAMIGVVALLLILSTVLNLRTRADEAARDRHVAMTLAASEQITRETRAFDLAGPRAASTLARTGLFDAARAILRDAVVARRDRAPALYVAGTARFSLNENGSADLDAVSVEETDAPPRAAALDRSALEAAAVALAPVVVGLGRADAAAATVAPFEARGGPSDASGFAWALWIDPARQVVIAAAITLDPSALAAAVGSAPEAFSATLSAALAARTGDRSAGAALSNREGPAGPTAISALATPTEVDAPREPNAEHNAEPATAAPPSPPLSPRRGDVLEATLRAPLADGALVLTFVAPLTSSPPLTAIAAPIALSLVIAIAFVAYTLSDRAYASELHRRHAATLRKIEIKQRALEDSEERFRHLAESTNVTPWTADLERQRFTYVGPQIQEVSGYSAETWRAPGFWSQHIHPADRGRVLRDAMERATDGRYTTLDYRVRAADGRVVHIRNMLTIQRETRDDASRGARLVARGFLLDVTELRQAAAALEVARRKAEEANRVKSEFLANMSHELRTPLNAVIGFSEIMKDEIFGPIDPRYREYAESVHASGRHLLELINDVLDLSKIEAGRIELLEEPTDIGGLVTECRTLLQERIAAAGLHEDVRIDPALPRMRIDDRRVKQVVLNLLSNAIKFTPPGGRVRLAAERVEGRGVKIAVRDTGVGMTPDEIPRALAKFGQIDGELARRHDGTGLGLPIAKSLIEMHGGALEVLSEKGKGTEMRVWLPESRILADDDLGGDFDGDLVGARDVDAGATSTSTSTPGPDAEIVARA